MCRHSTLPHNALAAITAERERERTPYLNAVTSTAMCSPDELQTSFGFHYKTWNSARCLRSGLEPSICQRHLGHGFVFGTKNIRGHQSSQLNPGLLESWESELEPISVFTSDLGKMHEQRIFKHLMMGTSKPHLIQKIVPFSIIQWEILVCWLLEFPIHTLHSLAVKHTGPLLDLLQLCKISCKMFKMC